MIRALLCRLLGHRWHTIQRIYGSGLFKTVQICERCGSRSKGL